MSSAASSASVEETCATTSCSDIEVISLPSTSTGGGESSTQHHNHNHHHQNHHHNHHQQQHSLQAHSDSSHTQLIANSNVVKVYPAAAVSSSTLSLSTSSDLNATLTPATAQTTTTTTSVNESSSSSSAAAEAEVREAQILKLNRQNVRLQEENDNVLGELERIKSEAQRVLAEMNARLEQVSAESEQMKRHYGEMKRELGEVRAAAGEREAQIKELTHEGMKLASKELAQSNIIKKLRAKEKENDEMFGVLKAEHSKASKELDELRRALEAKEECEAKNMEVMRKLEKSALTLEKELIAAKQALDESQEKCVSLENTLQSTFKELAELRKANAAKESLLTEATSSIETQLKEEAQMALDKERLTSSKRIEALKWEMESVRGDIARLEQQHAMREDMLRKEIGDLQQQLRLSEMRNNELSQSISNATRPLIRQIESLQVLNLHKISNRDIP